MGGVDPGDERSCDFGGYSNSGSAMPVSKLKVDFMDSDMQWYTYV